MTSLYRRHKPVKADQEPDKGMQLHTNNRLYSDRQENKFHHKNSRKAHTQRPHIRVHRHPTVTT